MPSCKHSTTEALANEKRAQRARRDADALRLAGMRNATRALAIVIASVRPDLVAADHFAASVAMLRTPGR